MKECRRCSSCQDDATEVCPFDGAPLHASLQGSVILDGKYKLESRLGEGGMGVIYRVRHLGLQRSFALKLIRLPEDAAGQFFARFRVEAEALGKLKHPNIVDVSDFGIDPRLGGVPYLVMEFLEGQTLREYCRQVGPLSLEQALPLFDSIARAIDFAHERGVLHRDLKPANVFLARNDSGGPSIKLLDFGLARLAKESRQIEPAGRVDSVARAAPKARRGLGEAETLKLPSEPKGEPPDSGDRVEMPQRLTRADEVLGTLSYMAPELLQGGEATSASDIYAFGILIFEVLVGKPPFQGSADEIMANHLDLVPPPPSAIRPAIPKEVDEAVISPLAKDPALRPRRAGEVVAQIRSAGDRARVRSWRAREIPRRLAICGLLAALLAGLASFLSRSGLVRRLEGKTVDPRFLIAPARPPDPRVVLVTVDEATLEADPTLLAERADEFGRELERVFEAGARGVAIDFLLPEKWSQSNQFSRLVLGHAESLTLAALSQPAGKVIGPECLSGLTASALGPKRASELFGFVNLEEDRDGVTRQARLSYLDREGMQRKSWAARAAEVFLRSSSAQRREIQTSGPGPGRSGERFWIDYSTEWPRFPRISWKNLKMILDRGTPAFRNRIVLLGGDFAASGDAHRVPHGRGGASEISGLVLQALVVNTIVSGRPVREPGILPPLMVTLLTVGAVAASFLCLPRLSIAVLIFFAIHVIYAVAAFAVFRWSRVIIPMAGPILVGVLAGVLALVLRQRLPGFPRQNAEVL